MSLISKPIIAFHDFDLFKSFLQIALLPRCLQLDKGQTGKFANHTALHCVEIFLSPQIFELCLTLDLIGFTPAKVEREVISKG